MIKKKKKSSNNCSSDVRLQDGTAAVSSGLTNVFFFLFFYLCRLSSCSQLQREQRKTEGGRAALPKRLTR